MTDPLVLNPDNMAATALEVFRRAWRTDLSQPGFVLLRFSREVNSHELRRAMVDLMRAFPVEFVPERFGRFDQQVSSKFHRDGAPLASLLVLGYEPTRVRSRFWVADVSAACARAGLSLEAYLKANNPMFPEGESALTPFITELSLPHGEAFVIVANNSQLPHDSGHPLGVLHKAVISPATAPAGTSCSVGRGGQPPDPGGTRVINSVGFTPRGEGVVGLSSVEVERFVTRDDLD